MADAGARVLIAHCDPVLLAAANRALYESGFDVVAMTDSGADAIKLIGTYEPDIVLMSLFLRDENAFCVLEQLNSLPLSSMPAVAVSIPEDHEEYRKRAEQLGAFAALPMPVLPAELVEAVLAAGPMDRMIPCFAKEAVIRDILNRMSLDRTLKGYEYLVTVIGIACRSHILFRALTTVVYQEAAIVHETSARNVERCIRHALDKAWSRGDMERQYAYFGNTIDGNRGKPTNSEFIARVTEALRLEAM